MQDGKQTREALNACLAQVSSPTPRREGHGVLWSPYKSGPVQPSAPCGVENEDGIPGIADSVKSARMVMDAGLGDIEIMAANDFLFD